MTPKNAGDVVTDRGTIGSSFTSSTWDASCSCGWVEDGIATSDEAMQALYRHREESHR